MHSGFFTGGLGGEGAGGVWKGGSPTPTLCIDTYFRTHLDLVGPDDVVQLVGLQESSGNVRPELAAHPPLAWGPPVHWLDRRKKNLVLKMFYGSGWRVGSGPDPLNYRYMMLYQFEHTHENM